MRLKVSLRMVGGSMLANLAGGVVGGTYNAFLAGDNREKTFAAFELSAVIQTITSGPWRNFIAKMDQRIERYRKKEVEKSGNFIVSPQSRKMGNRCLY